MVERIQRPINCVDCGKVRPNHGIIKSLWIFCIVCEAGWYCPKCLGNHRSSCIIPAVLGALGAIIAEDEQKQQPEQGQSGSASHPFWQCHICGDFDVIGSCMDCGQSVCVDDSAPESIGLICGNCRKANVAK